MLGGVKYFKKEINKKIDMFFLINKKVIPYTNSV